MYLHIRSTVCGRTCSSDSFYLHDTGTPAHSRWGSSVYITTLLFYVRSKALKDHTVPTCPIPTGDSVGSTEFLNERDSWETFQSKVELKHVQRP